MRERQRQRTASGARTVGFAGYTNAGKSSLFAALSNKPVLVEDRVFSTLETTVGRMERSPRVLLIDTIGFIDRVPADLLDAFRATLDESLQCDLLLLVVDASDEMREVSRRLETSHRELLERTEEETGRAVQLVLTKTDACSSEHLSEVMSLVTAAGHPDPFACSAATGDAIEELRQRILERLHGPPRTLLIARVADVNAPPIAALEAEVRREAMVIERRVDAAGVHLVGWMDEAAWRRLLIAHPDRLVASDSEGTLDERRSHDAADGDRTGG